MNVFLFLKGKIDMESETYERFPPGIILLSNAQTLLIYVIGASILAGFGFWFALLYVAYCLWFELRILTRSCVNCYYYGSYCGMGRGKVCSWFFKRGNPERFLNHTISWWDLVPDFMVSIIPLVGGIILLIGDFSWMIVFFLFFLLVLSTVGSAMIRGNFLCKFCKQRVLGCPAQQLFNRSQEKV